MPSAAGPVLALAHAPADLRPAVEAAFSRVWTGQIGAWDSSSSPMLAVVADHRPELCWAAARRLEEQAPWLPVIAVVSEARAVRSQRGLPANVAWAVGIDELEPATLSLALRYSLEHGRRRQLERQLEESRLLADVGWVASAVSHEIGNPLTSLLTNLEHLRGQLGAAVERREPFDVEAALAVISDAHEGARHIGRIAHDLGRASRRGGRPANVEVRSVVETARRLSSELLGGVEVRLRVRRCRPVRADETRLCQVLLNLLKNAALALRDTRSPTIELSVLQEGDQVVVRVHDNGPGVPPEMVPRLFRVGFTTRRDGSGLGLVLSRRYVEEMGGTLEHLPHVRPGACFQVSLPAVQTTSVAQPTLVPDRAQARSRVLVVDDMPLVRRAVQRALESVHEVVATGDGDAALAFAAERRFDVVLLDLHMPGRGGIELYEELLARHPDPARKVVFLSGAFDRDDLAYLEQRGLPWVRKPVGAEELRDLVVELTTA